MILVLQIFFVLALIVLLVLFAFKPKRTEVFPLPENYKELLHDYVKFYQRLTDDDKKKFEDRFQRFLSSVKITGANAEIEDLDRVLIGAGAIIPVFLFLTGSISTSRRSWFIQATLTRILISMVQSDRSRVW